MTKFWDVHFGDVLSLALVVMGGSLVLLARDDVTRDLGKTIVFGGLIRFPQKAATHGARRGDKNA